MRVLRTFAVLVIVTSMFFGCRKERSFESPNGQPVTPQEWQFKQGSKTFGGSMDSAFLRSIGIANSLSMSGPSADGKGEISLELLSNGAFAKGDYNNPQVLFQYLQNGSGLYQNTTSDNFTITITAIDSATITGTFSGIVVDSLGNKQTISDGKFTAPIGHTNTTTPGGRAFLTVWSKQLCDGSGNIEIKVGDSSHFITQAMAAEPSCGAGGAANFALNPGNYTVLAICGTDTMSYQASLLPNVCGTLEVNPSQAVAGDYFPYVTKWTYGNGNDYDGDTLSISNTGDTTIATQDGSFLFQKFYNDKTLETAYYRKDNGLYYRYLWSANGEALAQPLELIILKDNVPLMSSWESDPYDVDFGSTGIPFTLQVKLVSTITKKDYSLTIGNKTYNHCIEVSSELFQKSGDQWVDGDTGFITVFAKGIGIIQYQDLDTGDNWLIRNFNVSF